MTDDEDLEQLMCSPRIPQAQGLLAVLLDVPIDQAAAVLELYAEFRGVSVPQAADAVIRDHTPDGDDSSTVRHPELAILRHHLDENSFPLDLAR